MTARLCYCIGEVEYTYTRRREDKYYFCPRPYTARDGGWVCESTLDGQAPKSPMEDWSIHAYVFESDLLDTPRLEGRCARLHTLHHRHQLGYLHRRPQRRAPDGAGRPGAPGSAAEVLRHRHRQLRRLEHLLGSAIDTSEADLLYAFQSGALDESFADVSALRLDPDDLTIGEELPEGSGPLRHTRSP